MSEALVWVHKHSFHGRPIYTDGEGCDCPKERQCWEQVTPEMAAFLKEEFSAKRAGL